MVFRVLFSILKPENILQLKNRYSLIKENTEANKPPVFKVLFKG